MQRGRNRRCVRRFIHETEGGFKIDFDIRIPHVTTAERERQCRGVYYDSHRKRWVYCNRLISKGIKTLTVDGATGMRKTNYHHYCPRCAKSLVEQMKGKLSEVWNAMDKEENGRKNKKDIKLSKHKRMWEKIFH